MLKSKKTLRLDAKKIRKSLPIEEISNSIKRKLVESDLYSDSVNIFCFYSFRDEIDTHSLFQDKSKNWYVPKVTGDKMCACQFCLDMKENQFGIKEPVSENECDAEDLDLIILPALMIDKNGYRLGYGKGFYDRFLSSINKQVQTIALIPDELLVESLPFESFDVPVDIIITQSRFFQL